MYIFESLFTFRLLSKLSTAMKIYIFLSVIFIVLVWQSYKEYRTSKFLSLSGNDGVCEDSSRDVTAVFLADVNGNWEGDDQFEYSKAIYAFHFFHLETNEANFHRIVEAFLTRLDKVGVFMKTQNFAVTVLFWTTWMLNSRELDAEVFADTPDNFYFALTGNVGTVINQGDNYLTGLSGIHGYCNESILTRFDKRSATFRVTIADVEAYMENAACMDILDIRNLGYTRRIPTPQYDIIFDVNTVMACVAINLGIISLTSLELVPYSQGTVNLTAADGNYVVMSYGRFFHTRFPDMDTMYCFFYPETGEAVSCSIYMTGINLQPVFNHLGYSESLKNGSLGYCECDPSYSDSILFTCNAYSFVTGFLFYNYDNGGATYNLEGRFESDSNFFNLVIKYMDNFERLNRDSFDSCKETALGSFNSLVDPAKRERLFDYCAEGGMTRPCSVLTVTSYSTGATTSMSENYYQVPWGHCNDTTSISAEARRKLHTPPVRLTEVYYECNLGKMDAVMTAIGISSATVLSLKVAVVVFVTVVLAKGSTTLVKKSATFMTYGIDERLEALHYLAHNLLLARDGRYSNNDTRREALVQTLADELSRERYVNRFFPVKGESTQPSSAEVNPLHELEHNKSIQESSEDSSRHARERSQDLSVAELVHKRKLAAFQEELLANPFFTNK
mmetsp:Transcript_8750/g.14891  ORF Transcript_8750/g.14891 Transcript_8750/m.14891 type:complete len:674 (-) Transcript_8750:138-2159(-)